MIGLMDTMKQADQVNWCLNHEQFADLASSLSTFFNQSGLLPTITPPTTTSKSSKPYTASQGNFCKNVATYLECLSVNIEKYICNSFWIRRELKECMYLYVYTSKTIEFFELYTFLLYYSQHRLFIHKCKHFDYIEQQHISFNHPSIFH